ncbi:MAG TPA: DNA polymerase I [Candidatus Limiplasma sp.]|nr:DNA polymerase I [Candidatus Limiplasma sp.]HPS80235.1 DNA polymerase I [Candidatus Limiplasma sp.]
MPRRPESVLLVDGHSLIHRAFHALPPLSIGGVYTNAVQGFFSMLFKAIADYRPEALCVMFDMHAPTFRHTMYDAYKAGRKPTPEELRPQIPLVREILKAMDVTICALEGYEADDLLGTAAKLANAEGVHAYILTGDRDSLQLVSAHTQVILTKTGISDSLLLSPETVKEVYGYTPAQVPDMKGLMGDSSDNIPGVPGVGEKTALKLILQYGTLEGVLAHAEEIPGKLGEKLRENRELAELSKDLGTIRVSAPIQIDFDECGMENMVGAIPTLQKYQLNRLSQQLLTLFSGNRGTADALSRESDAATAALNENQTEATAKSAAPDPFAPRSGATSKAGRAATKPAPPETPPADEPQTLPEALIAAEAVAVPTEAELRQVVENLAKAGEPVALCLSASAAGLAATDGRNWFVPLALDILNPGLYEDQIFAALTPLFAGVPLIVHGAKALYHRLAKLRLPMPAVAFDTMIAAYLLEPTHKSFDLKETLAAENREQAAADETMAEEDPAPKGKKPAIAVEPPEVAAQNAASLVGLMQKQRARLEYKGMLALLTEMEMPLTRVLFAMEREGFSVDKAALAELGVQFGAEIERCRAQVIALTGGQEFNVNSPKQLGEVLFDRLKLPSPVKKSKAGAWSTSADVLETLDHPSIEPLLHYRKLTKLVGTYIEGLSKLVDDTGRIHTTFDQTSTVTGRISSVEPNLQNIPVRSEEGREIRRAFVAREGCVLLDADYSQIELRVLAHLSGDPAMRDAFLKGQDIHTRTAAEINGVPFESVTPAMRRSAKAVNFGIVYGISGFGLARNTGVSRKEADAFIAKYFERYPRVKIFMDESVHRGYELGYAETLFHRRRDLYELRSPNRNIRSFGERAAMNTPVQGTAADIIKLAMVRVQENLQAGGFQAKLILQVHDELVVECPVEETDAVSALLCEAMERIVTLSVPLVAEVNHGRSWYDAK